MNKYFILFSCDEVAVSMNGNSRPPPVGARSMRQVNAFTGLRPLNYCGLKPSCGFWTPWTAARQSWDNQGFFGHHELPSPTH